MSGREMQGRPGGEGREDDGRRRMAELIGEYMRQEGRRRPVEVTLTEVPDARAHPFPEIFPPPTSAAPAWLAPLLQGVTLLSIVGFAFWLGQLSNKITETTARVDKLYSVTLESRDSLNAQVSAINAKLDAMDKKLDELAKKGERGD